MNGLASKHLFCPINHTDGLIIVTAVFGIEQYRLQICYKMLEIELHMSMKNTFADK